MEKKSEHYSTIQLERLDYQPKLAPIFKNHSLVAKDGPEVTCVSENRNFLLNFSNS
jgi:hypothetical protein